MLNMKQRFNEGSMCKSARQMAVDHCDLWCYYWTA